MFFKEGLNNTGYIGSKKAIMIYGNGIINNSGKFISSDWITINGNPYLYNDGIIAAEKQILIYSPNVKDSKGMGAPHIFINGSDLMDPFYWVARMDTMGIIHWELEVGSYIPAVGGFATLVDGALYAIEGNSEEAKAKAKLIEKTGAKVEAKLLKGSAKAVNLSDELAKSGVKYNPNDVVAITKTADGKLLWLENGNKQAVLEHIMSHADDFAAKGIARGEIKDLVMTALEKGEIVGYQGKGTGRLIYEVVFKGEKQLVEITFGNNGFVVGANPQSLR